MIERETEKSEEVVRGVWLRPLLFEKEERRNGELDANVSVSFHEVEKY